VGDTVIRDRRHLSEDGIVLPILAINKHSGKLESSPEIVSRGFSNMDNDSQFMQMARQIVTKTLDDSNREEMTDWGVMKEKIRADLKRYINKETQKRPLIIPVILEI
jgi:ribonuclease J